MNYAKHTCRMKTATITPAWDSGGITLFHGDAKEILPTLSDQTIDACITDPPYGVTAARFDQPLPLDWLWPQLNRLLRDDAPIVLFSQQPFTSDLVSSNRKQFRCEWIWNKHLVTGNLNANVRPMRKHENVVVFSRRKAKYRPQMSPGKPYRSKARQKTSENYRTWNPLDVENPGTRFPTSIIDGIPRKVIPGGHPQQKPLEIMIYLIKTYSDPGDVILDFTCGSGTTLEAAARMGRRAIGIEREERFVEMAIGRLCGVFN